MSPDLGGEALRRLGNSPVGGCDGWGRFWSVVGANKLGAVNRAPRWLLPTVLTALILAVVVGALLG